MIADRKKGKTCWYRTKGHKLIDLCILKHWVDHSKQMTTSRMLCWYCLTGKDSVSFDFFFVFWNGVFVFHVLVRSIFLESFETLLYHHSTEGSMCRLEWKYFFFPDSINILFLAYSFLFLSETRRWTNVSRLASVPHVDRRPIILSGNWWSLTRCGFKRLIKETKSVSQTGLVVKMEIESCSPGGKSQTVIDLLH